MFLSGCHSEVADNKHSGFEFHGPIPVIHSLVAAVLFAPPDHTPVISVIQPRYIVTRV